LNTLSKEVLIINDLGLHARAAAKLAEIARDAESDVWIVRENETVDAKSIIDILFVAAAKGTRITIKMGSTNDIDVLNRMVDLVERGFGEMEE
jgi:phosphocarrier protein